MSDAKLERTILRFKSKIETGAYYEAHQTLRTITNRYVKSKQYKEAIEILYQGSSTLSSKKEYASASDLITYLIQVYTEANLTYDNVEYKNCKLKLIELINYLPDTDSTLPDLSRAAISWSQINNSSKFGDSELHHVFGAKFLNASKQEGKEDERQKVFAFAETHLVLGTHESVPLYVGFLYNWFQQSPDKDAGLFLSRAVINYAYLKNIKFTQEALTVFINKLTQDYSNYEVVKQDDSEIVFYEDKFPLINFLQLLVITLKKENSGQKFMKLYDQYKQVVTSNELKNSVDYLGRFYFNLNLGQSQGGQNMLANLMGGLFK